MPCVCPGLKEVGPRCWKEWRVLTYGKRNQVGSLWNALLSPIPHAASLRLAGWEEGRGSHLRVSSPRWQVPRRPCHSVTHSSPGLPGAVLGENIHPRDSLESLSEPWPWTAFPGSAKAISQPSPQGGEIRSAQCVAGRRLFLCRRNPSLQTHQMFLSPRQAQSEEFKSAEGDR